MRTIRFMEEQRNQPHLSQWHDTQIDHMDTFGLIGKRKLHIGGRAIPINGKLLYGDYDIKRDIEDIEERKQQFIKSNGRFVCFYCPESNNPFKFIEFIKESKYSFNDMFSIESLSVLKSDVWEFSGNLTQISCAFCFRIYYKKTIDQIREAIKGIEITGVVKL